MDVLVFNPGSNSLKSGIVRCQPNQRSASQGTKLIEVIVEGIGGEAKLGVYQGKGITGSEPVAARDFKEAAASIFEWLERRAGSDSNFNLGDVGCVGERVVHGGSSFQRPVEVSEEVEREILDLTRWAPLHNRRSVEILPAIRSKAPEKPIYAVFDTAFHSTIPDMAGLYAIPFELTQKHRIRRYGFHGISHRYLMERAAELMGQQPADLNLITMHLESGCSVTAISRGQSVDNTMGLTPLEGLMMGTRCGDIDPALPAFLAQAEKLKLDDVMQILEKKSGLLGVSGRSLDTRILMREYDSNERVRLAMEMFSYRLLKAIGAYLAVLKGVDAIIFGGGIAENTALVRQRVCDSLRWCGLEMDEAQNRALVDIEGRLSTQASAVQAYVIPVEEALQIAHECAAALENRKPPRADMPEPNQESEPSRASQSCQPSGMRQ